MTFSRIPILMYHGISVPRDDRAQLICLPPKDFARQMKYLREEGYTPVSLDALADGFPLPSRPVVLTFDDGYADNYENAFPVLRQHGFPAAVFLVTGCVGSINAWEKHAVPEMLLLGWQEIREMQKSGIVFGSHTASHRRLSVLPTSELRREIMESRGMIEDKLGCAVRHFAYPYGDLSDEIVAMVQDAGYRTACTTVSGFNEACPDFFLLRRLDIHGTDTLSRFARKLTYGTNDGSITTSLRYYRKRILERFRVWR